MVCLTVPADFTRRRCAFEVRIKLISPPPSRSRWLNRFRLGWACLANQVILFREIWQTRPDAVLLATYSEYLSPLWAWGQLLANAILGTRFVANLHDPVRNYRIGPQWWHDLSVKMAYCPLEAGLVHYPPPANARLPEQLRVVQVPVGVYEMPTPSTSRADLRAKLGIPQGSIVFIAVGYVRDNKNIDLVLDAAARTPEAFILVAGAVASVNDRPMAAYRAQAEHLGVAQRCLLIERFSTDDELAEYFTVADFVLLTYARSFRSQSGVLNLAVRAQKPVLASAGPGPLVDCVRRYGLGLAVEPDDAAEIARGMRQLIDAMPRPQWAAYEQEYGWSKNAAGVIAAVEAGVGQDK